MEGTRWTLAIGDVQIALEQPPAVADPQRWLRLRVPAAMVIGRIDLEGHPARAWLDARQQLVENH